MPKLFTGRPGVAFGIRPAKNLDILGPPFAALRYMLKNFLVHIVSLAIALQFTLVLPVNAAEDETPSEPVVPIYQYKINPASPSPIQEIRVLGGEANSVEELEVLQEALTNNKQFDAVTMAEPDEPTAVHHSFRERANRLYSELKAPIQRRVKLSSRHFGDWFVKNRLRISIVAIEVITVAGVKYTELHFGPQAFSHSVALTAGISMSALMGVVDWNTPRLIRFLTTTSTPVQAVLERISKMAGDERQVALHKTLSTAHQFTKNAGINLAIFSVFKAILLATTHDGTNFENALWALHALAPGEVLDSVKLSVLSTAVSFPTTMVILAYNKKAKANADGNSEALAQVAKNSMTMMSAALTSRALLFSSIIVGQQFQWQTLELAGYSGLGAIFVGSIWKLVSDLTKARRLDCAKSLAKERSRVRSR